MWEAKTAGFWITQLYVQVSLATSLRRNLQRNRTVPEDVLRSYVDKLDDAVHAVSAEPGLVDEAIAMDNNRDDEHQSEAERGRASACVRCAFARLLVLPLRLLPRALPSLPLPLRGLPLPLRGLSLPL